MAGRRRPGRGARPGPGERESGVASEYDVVVVGAGTGRLRRGIRAAQLGLKVAVVERQKALGGTCPDLGLHPHQGPAETRARAQGRPVGQGVGPLGYRRRQSRHRHAVGARPQGQDRHRTHRWHRDAVQEAQDRLDRGDRALTGGKGAEVTLAAGGTQAITATKSSSSPPDRCRARCPASRSTRSASSSATRRFTCRRCRRRSPSWAAALSASSSRRSSRATVARSPHRAAAVAGARRGRGGAAARALLQEAGHQATPGAGVTRATANGTGVTPRHAGQRTARRSRRPSRCCSWPRGAVRSPTGWAPRRSA